MKKNIFHELVTINENISLKYINLAFSDKIMNRVQTIFGGFHLINDTVIGHLSDEKSRKLINYYNDINLNDSYYELNKDIELFLYQMIKELIYHQSKDTNIYPNWFKSLLLEIQDLNKIIDHILREDNLCDGLFSLIFVPFGFAVMGSVLWQFHSYRIS